jgi:hypothetical protein
MLYEQNLMDLNNKYQCCVNDTNNSIDSLQKDIRY